MVVLLLNNSVKDEPNTQNAPEYSQCSDHYTVSYYQGTEKTKDAIPCSNDNDCIKKNMVNYCQPGYAELLRCIPAKYYCGDDGYCKSCNC
ncbi:hypothetical protein K8R42_03520 [bacterium]|nr:hypothetical protein [bacterium]